MPDVEDNMDELFKKAAGGYSLKNAKDDWDKIAPLLEYSTGAATATYKTVSVKKYSILLLALSLFLFIAGFIANNSRNKKVAPLTSKAERKILVEEIKEKDKNKNLDAVAVPNEKNASKKKLLNNRKEDVKQNHLGPDTKNITRLTKERKYRYNIYDGESDTRGSEKILVADVPVVNDKIFPEKISNEKVIIKKHHPSEYAANHFVLRQSISAIQLPGKKDDIIIEKKVAVYSREKVKKEQGVYIGFMFGPSFNQIKTQGLKKPGYDIGVIAGYQISKSLSVETGLMYDRKYYFSSGKYFDMSKVSASMPAGMKVLSLDGSSAVFEIPVKIKYNLPGKSNSNFYSIAGISTYIISNEFNKYRVVTNGTEQNITGTYNNSSRYLAAALDLSLGYQSKIGSFGSIRIEPYVQMPLKGIGVGSLPVMTAGLHIGFTRLIH